MLKNKNKENDQVNRNGSSAVYKAAKQKEEIWKALKEKSNVDDLYSYVFGKSEFNPLEEIRKKYK